MYFYLKEYKKAIKDLTVPIRHYEQRTDTYAFLNADATAYYLRGKSHAEFGEYTKSVEDYTEAIRLSNENEPSYYLARADAYYFLKEYEKAIKDRRKHESVCTFLKDEGRSYRTGCHGEEYTHPN